jgi:hypothetical protein
VKKNDLERPPKREPITDIRLELEVFIRHARDVGQDSLLSNIPDKTTRAMLQ